jgi:TonB-linked SusC/RagA family outer membrane protein
MRKIYIFLMLMLYSAITFGQQTRRVTGVVTEQVTNAPLIGVSVLVKGTKVGATTDKDGRYAIQVPSTGSSSLVFTYIGYLKAEINAGDKSVVNVALSEDSKSLNDVVVIGYGTSKKADLVSSVGRVDMNDMLKAPVRSIDEALAGRVAGVQVNSSDGQPGSGVNIVIRGANSITQSNTPLYVIDGFPIEGFNTNALVPSEIESIEVLKDAAATAIYGARAANGVVLVTTKKGKIGDPVISFNTTQSIDGNIKTMDLMSTYEFVKYNIEKNPIIGNATSPTPTYYFLTRPGLTIDDYKNISGEDWQSPFFQTGHMQDYSLSIRGGKGGAKPTLYSISGNLNNHSGTIINTGYKRYQGRITIDQTLSKKLKVGLNTSYTFMQRSGLSAAQGTGGSGTTNILYSVWGSSPLTPISDEGGEAIDDMINSTTDYRYNPLLNQQNSERESKTTNLSLNTYLEYSILPSLKLRMTGIVNQATVVDEAFNNSKSYLGNPITAPGRLNGVNGSIYTGKVANWANENTLTWSKVYNKKHNFNVLAGFTAQGNKSERKGFGSTLLPNEKLGLSGLEEGVVNASSIVSVSSLWNLASFLGRAKYNYDGKYYVEASYRADGSSKFASKNHWGYFPSVATSWRFSKEDFLKESAVLSEGKLRLSYGRTGNNRVDDFAYMATNGLPAVLSYSFNNSYVASLIPGYTGSTSSYSLGNAEVKWETTDQYNAGVDLGFLKDRISLTVDVYKKITKDLLLRANLPYSSGYNMAYKNIGKVENKGLEVSLNTTNIQNGVFKWTSSFNISFNRNKVLGLAENQETLLTSVNWDNGYTNTPAYIAKIGEPLGQMFGYIWEGVYQLSDFDQTASGGYKLKAGLADNGNANVQPGDIKYRDLNGDGTINASDNTVIGNSLPLHIGGFANNFSYKQFDLNVFFQWSYGNDAQNVNRFVFDGNGLNKTYLQQFASYNDRWSLENQDSKNFRANGIPSGAAYSSRTVEDASFLRLKTVSFGYNLPKTLLKKVNVSSLRVFVSGQNLYTWTKYSGLDPEVSTYNTVLTGGFDYSAYPRARTIALGLNLTL